MLTSVTLFPHVRSRKARPRENAFSKRRLFTVRKIFAPFLFLSLSRALSLRAPEASGGIRAGTFISLGSFGNYQALRRLAELASQTRERS
jgi:hypothetical protein